MNLILPNTILLSFLLKSVISANILYISSIPSPSHHIWNRALAYGLAARGHNVTLADPDEDKTAKPKNFSLILFEGLYEGLHDEFDLMQMAKQGSWDIMKSFQGYTAHGCRKTWQSKGFQTLLSYPSNFKFDLIIYDVSLSYCLHPILSRFDSGPVVGVTAFLLPQYLSFYFGNNLHPSYLPWFGVPYSGDMTFIQRTWNYISTYADIIHRHYIQYNEEDDIVNEILPRYNQKSTWRDAEKRLSLLLANTDPILNYPQPLPPNIIPVGGLHTRPSKDLPQEWMEILNDAKNGAIIFSLGTNIRSENLGEKTIETLLKIFAKFQETVIWKFESNAITDLPKNVIIRKWLPQGDLLGHPNVKLFIGHGGALSTQEAIYHGVPMLCIPFIVDQQVNSRLIVQKKLGVMIDFEQLVDGDFTNKKIREILDDPTYYENMKEASRRFKDRSETPLERGIFWIEYVLRHGDTYFLQTKARGMPFFQASGLDVATFLVVVVIIIVLIVYKTLSKICHLLLLTKKVKIQ